MIYLDYNATTPLCEDARDAMLSFLDAKFGNPSSVHSAGRIARAAIDDARDKLAALLRVKPHELIFTSGGTESNNLAVLGLARANVSRGKHLISSRTEHHAVLNAFEHLQKREGFEVAWINVSRDGLIDLDQLASAIRDDTTLVSLMHANNETGFIQPLAEISEICRERGVLLHSDMVQSFGKISHTVIPSEAEGPRCGASSAARLAAESLDSAWDERYGLSLVDAASFAAHKFYGPKGAGLLYLREGLTIEPMAFGGEHENQRRPGTENVAAIAGMAAAAEFVLRDLEPEQNRERELRNELWRRIGAEIPSAHRNGSVNSTLSTTLNVSFPGLESETLLMAFDLEGLCASSGSACMVGSVVASHVLLAMNLPLEIADSAVRLSLGKFTTREEVEDAADIIVRVVTRLFGVAARRSVAYAAV